MFKIAQPFFLHVISPLHAGSGSQIGVIDLPIQRERHTGFPKIESSSLKGAIREVFEEHAKNDDERVRIHKIFGYDNAEKKETVNESFKVKEQQEFAGAIGFTDARLLLFPVKAMKGVFAYATCLHALKTFNQDVALCQQNGNAPVQLALPSADLFKPQNDQSVCLAADKHAVAVEDFVLLEEYAFKVNPAGAEVAVTIAKTLAELIDIKEIAQKLVILSDVDFRDFVEMSTEVITRTKINNETGTVQEGALFTEEFLPAESVLYALALGSPLFLNNKNKKDVFEPMPENADEEAKCVLNYFTENLPKYIQIGGDATIGKGIVRTQTWGAES